MSSTHLLETRLEEPRDEVAELKKRVARLERDIENLRSEAAESAQRATESTIQRLFTSLHHATSVLVGEQPAASPGEPASDAKWTAIKSRLSSSLAQVIDVLLLQGPMKTSHVASAVKCSGEAARQRLDQLRRQGLVEKVGQNFQLR